MPSATVPAPFTNSPPLALAEPALCADAGHLARSPRDPGFGVYVHWPFCKSKCPYCDFNSHVRPAIDHDRWRAAYLREIDGYADRLAASAAPVTSVFFGGGTPSLMEPATVGAILERLAARLPMAADVEITLEANPTSAEAGKFRDLRAAGVNRLSLGIQALRDADLGFLGREHDTGGAKAALAAAQSVFERVTFDLIYARPRQTDAEWRAELREALGFATSHISLYQLTIEPGTRFFEAERRGDLVPADEDTQAALFETTQELCEAAGLAAYEVSNHARPGHESRHNLTYWRSGEWLGIGPGAHGRLSRDGRRVATSALRSPEAWLAGVDHTGTGLEQEEPLSAADVLHELVLMGLRLSEGIDAERLASATGHALSDALSGVDDLVAAGMLTWDGARLRATPRGRLVLNRVVAALLP